MKRTWKRFAVLAGCAAWSLLGSPLMADPYRPASAYTCPHLEREKCEKAARLAQSELIPSPEAATEESTPAEESPAAISPETPTQEPQPTETPVAPVAVTEEAVPAAAVSEEAAVSEDLDSAWNRDGAGAGNILVFELNSENEGLEGAVLEAAPLVEIDYEALVAREALGADAGRAAAFDPPPAPPAELTDAAPVVEAVEVPAATESVVESAPVAEAAPEATKDEWGYARWLASELYGEMHRLAIHEVGSLVKAAGGSLENARLADRRVVSDEVGENVPASDDLRAIEVVAEPESQSAPVSPVNVVPQTENVPAESAVDAVLETSVGEEPSNVEPAASPAESVLESNVEVDPEQATEASVPASETSSEEAAPQDETSEEANDSSAEESSSYLPETLEDFGRGYAFPDLEV